MLRKIADRTVHRKAYGIAPFIRLTNHNSSYTRTVPADMTAGTEAVLRAPAIASGIFSFLLPALVYRRAGFRRRTPYFVGGRQNNRKIAKRFFRYGQTAKSGPIILVRNRCTIFTFLWTFFIFSLTKIWYAVTVKILPSGFGRNLTGKTRGRW